MKVVVKDRKELAVTRIRKGYTLRGSADKCGLSITMMHKIESGLAQTVSPPTAKKICNAYEKTFDELFDIID